MYETADAKIGEALRSTAVALRIRLPRNLTAAEVPGLLNEVEALTSSGSDPSAFTKLRERFKLLIEIWTELPPETRRARRPQLVILIHGIRTHAEWEEELAQILGAPHRHVIPLGYEFFDVFRFLCPCFTRDKPIRKLQHEIQDALSEHGDHELVIIAHSFGTFAVSEILKDNPGIQPNTLVFCGGIVSESFRWDCLKNVPSIIVNECGIRDIWPVMAKSLTWGYGATGRFGFRAFRVRDRFHDLGHGGFLNPAFARRFWLPLVETGDLEPGLSRRPVTHYLVSVLSILRIAWLLPVLLVGEIVWYFLLRR